MLWNIHVFFRCYMTSVFTSVLAYTSGFLSNKYLYHQQNTFSLQLNSLSEIGKIGRLHASRFSITLGPSPVQERGVNLFMSSVRRYKRPHAAERVQQRRCDHVVWGVCVNARTEGDVKRLLSIKLLLCSASPRLTVSTDANS